MTTKTKNSTVRDTAKRGPFILQDAASKLYLKPDDTFTVDPMDAETWDTEQEAINAIKDLAEEAAHEGVTFRHWHQGNAAMFFPKAPEDADADDIVQGELLPSDAGVAAPAPVTGTLVLSSPGGALMTATALKAHAADLKKLAKGARDLSQHKEALTFEQNATMIEETLLVQLEPQAKLPFGYADVKKALGDRISGKLRNQLVTAIKRDTPLIEGDSSGKERAAKIEQRIDDFEELVGNVASIVTALVEPVISQAAEKGMLAGRLARETTSETLALEALEAVNNA